MGSDPRVAPKRVRDLANQLHRENGHPKGYDGPCWGPTQAEWAEARRVVSGFSQNRSET